MIRSSFTVLLVRGNSVLIQDDNGKVSVTNDAENVTHYLYGEYGNKDFYYYDSQNNLCKLVHEHGIFKEFAPMIEIG